MGLNQPNFAKRTIETINGPIVPPRAKIPPICPQELTVKLAKVIGERWACGGNFLQIADAVIDSLCHHIAKCSMEKMDPRISDAVEDHMSVEAKEGDVDAEQEASIEDLNAMIERVRDRHHSSKGTSSVRGYCTAEDHAEDQAEDRAMNLRNWKGGGL